MESAMAETQDKYEFRVSWEPFLLRPNMPPEGIPKSGPRVGEHLKTAGASVGIDFTGKCPVYPYTLNAHVLLETVKDQPTVQNQLAEALFKAYFTDGNQLDRESLLQIAESVGIKKEEAALAIDSEDKVSNTYKTAIAWSNKGVSGVPYFYMNGQKTFSGAQDSATFTRMFEIITDKFSIAENTSVPEAKT